MARRTMRSGLETQVKDELDGSSLDYKYEETRLRYTIPAAERTYLPDFEFPNKIIIEVKGKLDLETRRKMLLVKEHNPDRDIRFVFHRNNLLRKRGKLRYSDWAKRHGFKFCFMAPGKTVYQDQTWKEILLEWYNE